MIEENKLRKLIKLWRDNAEFLQCTGYSYRSCTRVTEEADNMASVYNGCARTLEIYLEATDEELDGS